MSFEFTETRAKELVSTFTDARKAKKALEALAEGKQFTNALESPIGRELVADAVKRREELLIKIAKSLGGDERIKEQDKIEYKVLDELLVRWAERIAQYVGDINEGNQRILKRRAKNVR